MSARIPLKDRAGFKQYAGSSLGGGLIKLAENQKFLGAVVIGFDGERVHVCPAGSTPVMLAEMQKLADRLLAAIDDGFFDPEDPAKLPQRRLQ